MKHYLRQNIASAFNYYWSRPAQNWTTDHTEATLFDSDQAATQELAYAEKHTDAEVLVCVKTK